MLEGEQNIQWEFCITTGILVTLIVVYLAQCVRLSHMPVKTRNKMTMTIWWSILLNLVSFQVRNVIMILLDIKNKSCNELTNYALESITCFFFTNALMFQTFEWDLLGAMIIFQS